MGKRLIGGTMKKRNTSLVFALIAFIFLVSCGGGANESSTNKEPVYVSMYCDDTYVQTGREIAIYYEWLSKTLDQNDAYFDAVVDHYISEGGVPIKIKDQGEEKVKELADGTSTRMFWMNIGALKPGTYEIVTVIDITEPVFDGWYWYGPDSDYESLDNTCTITVGDEPPADFANEEDSEGLPTNDVPDVPTPTSAVCPINSPLKQEWNTLVCETFDNDTFLWTGHSQGTSARVEGGQYVLDNSTKVSSGYTTGFTYPVEVGSAQDYLISVDGYMDSKFRDCTWGVFVRSTDREIVYFFMINNEGRYMLTGSSDLEASRYLGNIKSGSHSALIWDAMNNITAVVEGKSMEFYVNDELLLTHEAINAVDPNMGLIVWGGEGVSAVNYFDNLLVLSK
jgi:hypothetical protein